MNRSSTQVGSGRGGRVSRKRPRRDEDRITNLPELVLSKILSLVPTKDAVRTNVLSKAWKRKWTSSQCIDIDDNVLFREQAANFFYRTSTKVNFVRFVERAVLLSLKNTTSFRLSLSRTLGSPFGYDLDRMAAWICTVSRRNVKSLIVDCVLGGVVDLLGSLLLNNLLTNLELRLSCTLKVPASIFYPNLKILNLTFVQIINEPSSGTLTLAFPVLEIFKLFNCKFLNLKTVEVHAPELKTFECAFTRNQAQGRTEYSIKIFSRKLVEFRFSSDRTRRYILFRQKVIYATLGYGWPRIVDEVGAIRRHALYMLTGFSNLRELTISCSLTMAIAHSAAAVSVPVLRYLVRLIVYGDALYAKGLLEFLQSTPVLKFLKVLNMMVVYDNDSYDCNAVERVPPCITDQLEEFEFGSFDDKVFEYNLVKFLVNNGRDLKVDCIAPRWID